LVVQLLLLLQHRQTDSVVALAVQLHLELQHWRQASVALVVLAVPTHLRLLLLQHLRSSLTTVQIPQWWTSLFTVGCGTQPVPTVLGVPTRTSSV
jgi:hypothetical protein